jgi:hypothetical protein
MVEERPGEEPCVGLCAAPIGGTPFPWGIVCVVGDLGRTVEHEGTCHADRRALWWLVLRWGTRPTIPTVICCVRPRLLMLPLQTEVHLVTMRKRGERLTEFRTLCPGLIWFDKSRDNGFSNEPAPEEKDLCLLRFYEVVLGRQRLESELWPI